MDFSAMANLFTLYINMLHVQVYRVSVLVRFFELPNLSKQYNMHRPTLMLYYGVCKGKKQCAYFHHMAYLNYK